MPLAEDDAIKRVVELELHPHALLVTRHVQFGDVGVLASG